MGYGGGVLPEMKTNPHSPAHLLTLLSECAYVIEEFLLDPLERERKNTTEMANWARRVLERVKQVTGGK